MPEEMLRERIEASQTPPRRTAPADELVDALVNLGYRRTEAEMAAEKGRETGTEFEEQLKHALRLPWEVDEEGLRRIPSKGRAKSRSEVAPDVRPDE